MTKVTFIHAITALALMTSAATAEPDAPTQPADTAPPVETPADSGEEAPTEPAEAEAEAEAPEPTPDPEAWRTSLIPKVAQSSATPSADVVIGQPVATEGRSRVPGKVYLPYAPRPKTPLPPGWVIRPSDTLPPITRKVQLDNGRIVSLQFPTFVIVPSDEADGALKFADPGFDPRHQEQTNTVSSTLKTYSEQAKAQQETLGAALREIEQVILSSPRPPANGGATR